MKVLMLKIGEKVYTTGKITAYLSREALKIQTDALKMAKQGQLLAADSEDVDAAGKILEDLTELRNRKSWLICQVYCNAFTMDEMEQSLDSDEIDEEINRIITGISGVVTKN